MRLPPVARLFAPPELSPATRLGFQSTARQTAAGIRGRLDGQPDAEAAKNCGAFALPGRAPLGIVSDVPELCPPIARALPVACGAERVGAVAPDWPERWRIAAPLGGGPTVAVLAANLTSSGPVFVACVRASIDQVLADHASRQVALGVYWGLGAVALCLAGAGVGAVYLAYGRDAADGQHRRGLGRRPGRHATHRPPTEHEPLVAARPPGADAA